MCEATTWRSQLGASAALWSSGGRHAVGDGRWVALSYAPTVALNTILCSGGSLPENIITSIEEIRQVGTRAIIMLAGEGLGWAQVLMDSGWVCVGAQPMMRLDCSVPPVTSADDEVRELGVRDLATARKLFAEGNDARLEIAEVALPEDIVASESSSLWGAYADTSLVSLLAVSKADDAACIWSMTTDPTFRRRGYGRRLLAVVLSEVAARGSTHVLLTATPMSEALYRSVGFSVIEHWQQWSRPRWMFGRT